MEKKGVNRLLGTQPRFPIDQAHRAGTYALLVKVA